MSVFSYWPGDGPALAPPLPTERGLASALVLPTLQKHRTQYASTLIIPIPLRLPARIYPGAAATKPLYIKIGSGRSAFTVVKNRTMAAHLNWISSAAVSSKPEVQNGRHESQLHNNTSGKKKKFDCPTCGKYFQYPRSLETHKLVHTDTRPHVCPYQCGKSFRQSGHLQTHILIHTGEKPFKCPVTGCKTPAFRHANRRCPYHPTDRLKKAAVPMRDKAADRSPGSAENHPDDVAIAMALVELSRKGFASSGY